MEGQHTSGSGTVGGGPSDGVGSRHEASLADRAVLGDAGDAVSDALDQVAQLAGQEELIRSTHERSRHAAQRSQAAADRQAAVTQLAAAEAEIAGLRQALVHRGVIGEAVGIIMATERINDEEAFQRLVRMSQSEHIKLRDLAAHLVAQAMRTWTTDTRDD